MATALYAVGIRARLLIKQLAKLAYWRLCFPDYIDVFPVRLRVISGPFQGMRYTDEACASAHSAKLLGTYEKELHKLIDCALNDRFDRIINIGAAEGYYAVGLSRMFSGKVFAFEAQELGRELPKELADRNSANVEVRGACDFLSLDEALHGAGRTLIVCDVEGFEAELLDPARVSDLNHCTILVELHDSDSSATSKILRERFQGSHTIEEVIAVPRTWKDFPGKNIASRILPRQLALRAMNESRGEQSWFWMQPINW